jgi:hypothetical protein
MVKQTARPKRNPRPAHQPSPRPGYERRDADVRSLVKFGVGLFLILAFVLVSMKWMFFYFAQSQQLGSPVAPVEYGRVIPPQPLLQVEPKIDLRNYRERQEEALTSYGWVDQPNGVVRIPIGRAMDLVVERGLPTRTGGTQQ